ncbi:MAG: DNA mismatch repair endonuclease MutL [Clostridiales bacterium]|nr:DNA mismatch repair endonuclease MutL [Clostridiales bacterium]
MPKIELLAQDTIDKIAAGEVVERPSSVVKELVENAIDAGADKITAEIKDGGISMIRITDNGCGIAGDEVQISFLRHATSKIRDAADLTDVHSLGFRGEALSSIAAVSRVEMVTKTDDALLGTRYVVEGGAEISNEEVGAPDGTTIVVRDLFYNTPARKKFLRTAQTEGSYVGELVERLAMSHADISFQFINNGQVRLHTSGNGQVRDSIYNVYGRDITAQLLPVDFEGEYFSLAGFIAKPTVSRGNRNYEVFFVNGRYVKSNLLSMAVEEAYKPFMMQHQFPFAVLYFSFPGEGLDVNVHPSKMELRIDHNKEVYRELAEALTETLTRRELIPEVPVGKENEKRFSEPKIHAGQIPEPFEKNRTQKMQEMAVREEASGYGASFNPGVHEIPDGAEKFPRNSYEPEAVSDAPSPGEKPEQLDLSSVSPEFLSEEARQEHRIIGQIFRTYWLVEYRDSLYIIDQHAAHEKVLYERTMRRLKNAELTSQSQSPPIVISLDAREQDMLEKYRGQIEAMGYEVESFGGNEYMISAVPDNLFSVDGKDLFIEMLDDFSTLSEKQTPDLILEKVASMSCKAAVKGNNALSFQEADALISELLTLDNPFNCPHGRPTIISMSKYELEKKFKRIV